MGRDSLHQNKRINNIILNEEGQSTIEFISSLTFVMLLFGFLIRLAFFYTNGFFVHYEVFKASRAYLVYDNNLGGDSEGAAVTFANDTFSKKDIQMLMSTGADEDLRFNRNSGGEAVYNGVYYFFKQKISLMGFFGEDEYMRLRSDSFIGREPTRFECVKQVCKAISSLFGGDSCVPLSTIADNGC